MLLEMIHQNVLLRFDYAIKPEENSLIVFKVYKSNSYVVLIGSIVLLPAEVVL